MEKSESIKEIATALNKAQAEMSGAQKKSKNPFFKSSYANLEEVINCVKEPFMNNGLSYMQWPIASDGYAGVETIIMHTSGEWISSELLLKCSKNDPQGMGSAITYARRYSLQAAAGVPSEDDDGNKASAPQKPTYKEPVKLITSEDAEKLKALAMGKERDWVVGMLAHFKVKKFSELPLADVANVKKSMGIK